MIGDSGHTLVLNNLKNYVRNQLRGISIKEVSYCNGISIHDGVDIVFERSEKLHLCRIAGQGLGIHRYKNDGSLDQLWIVELHLGREDSSLKFLREFLIGKSILGVEERDGGEALSFMFFDGTALKIKKSSDGNQVLFLDQGNEEKYRIF